MSDANSVCGDRYFGVAARNRPRVADPTLDAASDPARELAEGIGAELAHRAGIDAPPCEDIEMVESMIRAFLAERERLGIEVHRQGDQGGDAVSTLRTFCPECGPNVYIDEDGCCTECGALATGEWVSRISVRAEATEVSDHDPVRELAEKMALEAADAQPIIGERHLALVDFFDSRLRAYLAERDAERGLVTLEDPTLAEVMGPKSVQAGQLAAMRSALEAVAGGCAGGRGIKGRCQACGRHEVHLASCVVGRGLETDAGRLEAEVLRAAYELINEIVLPEKGGMVLTARNWPKLKALRSAVDALQDTKHNVIRETP